LSLIDLIDLLCKEEKLKDVKLILVEKQCLWICSLKMYCNCKDFF
jgi:hypothetical protein